jgi:hypothetical protein
MWLPLVMQGVSKKEFYSCIPNVTVWRVSLKREELLEWKSSGSGLNKRESVTLTTRHPLSAKLALTSPTNGGPSVGVVRSRTEVTVFCLFVMGGNYLINLDVDGKMKLRLNFKIYLNDDVDWTMLHSKYWLAEELLDSLQPKFPMHLQQILSKPTSDILTSES